MIHALVLPLLAALQAPAAAPSPNPYAIYRAAMARVVTLQEPKYIINTEHWLTSVTGGEQSQQSEWDERVVLNSLTRMECVLNVPFRPTAFPEIGESQFAPDSWLIDHFGARSHVETKETPAFQPDLSDLRTVANVVSVAKPSYDIRLLGVTPLSQGSAYHLVLRPLYNPRLHNIRELWIDTQTHAITRAVLEGDYRPDFYTSMPDDTYVTEDFGQVGPYWLVVRWIWTYRAPFSNTTYAYDAKSLSMRFPDKLPDWFFDRKQFWKHASDVNAYVGCDADEPCNGPTQQSPSIPVNTIPSR